MSMGWFVLGLFGAMVDLGCCVTWHFYGFLARNDRPAVLIWQKTSCVHVKSMPNSDSFDGIRIIMLRLFLRFILRNMKSSTQNLAHFIASQISRSHDRHHLPELRFKIGSVYIIRVRISIPIRLSCHIHFESIVHRIGHYSANAHPHILSVSTSIATS